MANKEHFQGKNETVIQYSLGHKYNQQTKYIRETRPIKENGMALKENPYSFSESLNYDRNPQDISMLIINDTKKQRFSSKVGNSRIAAKPGEINKCRIYGAVIFMLAILAIIALVTFCIIYFGVLTKMPTHLQACSTSNPCVYFKNLFCNGTCICSSDQYWNGTMCTDLIGFGGSCTNTYQCDSELTCSNKICQCTSTTVSFKIRGN
jgi:hypothetical protein